MSGLLFFFTVAIPLVNPQLELLPVHFAVDPGIEYNWPDADECNCFDLLLDKKVRLIEQYVDLKVSTMPTKDSMKQAEAFDRLMHCRRGSLDSAQIDLLVGAGRSEDGRRQGSASISRQIRGAVMKTFGSLGQSVSEKLKSMTCGSKSNKLSVGSTTQSSRRSTLAVQMLTSHHHQVQWVHGIC